MKSLIEKLGSCEAEYMLWFEPGSNTPINLSSLIFAINQIASHDWQGKRIALGNMPIIEFVFALIYLDGLAEAILLLPTEENAEAQALRLAQDNIDVVLNEEGLGFSKLIKSAGHCTGLIQTNQIAGNQLRNMATTWLLPTSGTTGIPKLIPHTFSSLTRSMSNRRIGDEYVWGSLYSLRRFAGLQVFLQAWMAGTPMILNEDVDLLTDVLPRLIKLGCNALSATPSMWRKLAMYPVFDQLNIKQITLGGEIADQGVLDMLIKRFPKARITHIYASTEAGVGFAVRDGKSGFPTHYLDSSPSSVAMRIDENGHLWFRLLSNMTQHVCKNSDWIDSGDVVQVEGDRVMFIGRANGSINVGGNKVMPEEVETVIKELPEIAFVQVRARKSAILGSLIEAAILVNPGTIIDMELKKKITSHCRTRLDAYKVPAFIVEDKEIKLTASGKLSRENI